MDQILGPIAGVVIVLLGFGIAYFRSRARRYFRYYNNMTEASLGLRKEADDLGVKNAELKVENDVLHSLVKAQAERAKAYGLNDPILIRHSDGHLYPEETFIREEP